MSQKIFLMGCWNKNSCLAGEEFDGRSEVLNMLSEEPNDYDLGILLGDNIYPLKIESKRTKKKGKRSKTKKIKKFLQESKNYYQDIIDISNLITSNSKMRKNLHVILGNHDVEKECVLENQIKTFNSTSSKIYVENGLLETDYAVFLMLNTNDVGSIVTFLDDFDSSILKERWLIICGHDPIYSYKPKKKRIYQEIDEKELIFRKISEINYPKMAYFCADTHNYQLLEVGYYSADFEFHFPIIVVGTGGAKPDKLKGADENKEFFNDTSDLFVSLLDYNDPFGFLELEISQDKLNLKYKKCGSENICEIFFEDDLSYTIDYKEKDCRAETPKCFIEEDPTLLELC